MSTLYQKAKNYLKEQYLENFEIVKSSDFHRAYVNEKIRHSLQVSGAGNGILRNEKYFMNRSEEFIDIAKTAIVLHDIFRFTEVRRWFETGQKSDHGVEGAAMLKNQPPFNDIRITLSIKHHGHLIEDFYRDEEFLSLADSDLKQDIEHIHFAVRDADKIANWQILTNEFEAMRPVWLPHPEDFSARQSQFTPQAWESFTQSNLVAKKDINTNADTLLSVLSWLFDINYHYAVTYCQRLDLFNKFYNLFEKIGVDSDKRQIIKEITENYLQSKFGLKL